MATAIFGLSGDLHFQGIILKKIKLNDTRSAVILRPLQSAQHPAEQFGRLLPWVGWKNMNPRIILSYHLMYFIIQSHLFPNGSSGSMLRRKVISLLEPLTRAQNF